MASPNQVSKFKLTNVVGGWGVNRRKGIDFKDQDSSSCCIRLAGRGRERTTNGKMEVGEAVVVGVLEAETAIGAGTTT
jgi:hypothetical protein